MFNTGDLVPQQSGSASIGARQTGFDGLKMPPTPYNNIHIHSGIWHHSLWGQSGVIRLAPKVDLSYRHQHDSVIEYHPAGNQTCFELSIDGGRTFPLRLGATRVLEETEDGPIKIAVIRTQDNDDDDLYIYSSGQMDIVGSHGLRLLAFGNLQNSSDQIEVNSRTTRIASSRVGYIQAGGDLNIIGGLSPQADNANDGDIIMQSHNSSGLLHFRHNVPYESWYMRVPASESIGGPFSNGEWPIAHSGNVNEMINRAIATVPGGSTSLQTAYNNGNEIAVNRDLIGYKGVLVKETIPGLIPHHTSNADITTNKPGKYSIAVSGFTLTPTNNNSFSFLALSSASLMIASSGTPSALSRSFFLGFVPGNVDTSLYNCDGNVQFAIGDQTGRGTGGQILLDAFASSGRLQYRFGPHQAWAAKLTHASNGGPANDGFWPIAHSGQMLEQIARAIKTKALTIERPAVNNDLTLWYTNEAITIHEVESVVRGTADASGSFAIRYSPNRSLAGTELTTEAIQCTSRSTGQITTSFAAPNIPADSWVWVAVSGVSGVATTQMNVTIQYK